MPTAFFIGIFRISTNAGMIKKPPPAPKKPVARPTKIPYNKSFTVSPAVDFVSASTISFLPLIMAVEAMQH